MTFLELLFLFLGSSLVKQHLELDDDLNKGRTINFEVIFQYVLSFIPYKKVL